MDWNSLRWETAVWKPFLLHFVWESSFNLVLCLGLRCNYRSFVSPSARWAVSCSSLIVGFTSWNRHSLKKKKKRKTLLRFTGETMVCLCICTSCVLWNLVQLRPASVRLHVGQSFCCLCCRKCLSFPPRPLQLAAIFVPGMSLSEGDGGLRMCPGEVRPVEVLSTFPGCKISSCDVIARTVH